MKKAVLLILCLLLPFDEFAQVTYPGNWSLSSSLHHGFIAAHRPAIIHLQQKHVNGFELSWQKAPDENSGWANTFNYPWLGFTYIFMDLGNPKELGNAHGIFPCIYFPLIRNHPHTLNLRFGWGLGYVERPFNPDDNYKNLAIGSRINSGINSALLFQFPLATRIHFSGGINFTHYSNGASQMPNLGLNMTTISAGLRYYAGESIKRTKTTVIPKRKGTEITVSAVAGLKDLYPPGGKRYIPVNLSVNGLHDLTPKSMIGGGIDLGIDPSMKSRLEEDQRDGFGAIGRAGVHLSYGLHIGRCYGIYQAGTYLASRLTLDGSIYSRLSFRYYINNSLYACFNLKSHFGKADYFETGIGYAFRK
jgi:hypothetical protein